MLISDLGILLGNFVPSTGPALEKGQFVGVSAPIGKSRHNSRHSWCILTVPKRLAY
jgi:hypothetical protein